jgi:DNA replication protein DnaC
MEPIDRILKKNAADMSKASSPTSSSTDPDAEPCPICGGVGFVRQELALDHPDFGRLVLCSCRQTQASQTSQDRLLRLSNLQAYQAMTFDSFKAQGRLGLADEQIHSLQYAMNQSVHFSQTLRGWLLLMGSAIAHTAVANGVPTLFLTVPDLLDWLRFSYGSSEQGYEERFDEIRNIPLLVLDDLGTQNATAWAQEKLYQILNHRYIHEKLTVITTNQDLEEIDGRIRSRLQDPGLVTSVKILAPDFRTPMRDSIHPQLSSLHLHSGRTLGNFSLRENEKMSEAERQSLVKAFHAAQTFAEKLPGRWLVLSGTYGTGKTHLAAGIGNYRAARGDAVMFVVVPDLLDHLRATFSPVSPVSYDQLFENVLTARLLVLDDLGTQSATPWAREKLYQILNYRYNAELPTVITTAQRLEDIDPRIQSRMLDSRLCTVFALLSPPYRPGGRAAEAPARRTRKSG